MMNDRKNDYNNANNKKATLKEAFDAELMKQLEKNPPEIPTYEEFSAMVDGQLNKRRCKNRIIGIAASLAIVLIASIFAATQLTCDVDADKNPKEEIITEDGVIIEDGGWGSTNGEEGVWVIEDWHDVKGIKIRFSEILLPKYIPKRYEFESLIVEAINSGVLIYKYKFVCGENSVEVEIQHFSSALSSFEVNNVVRKIKTNKGLIYIQEKENKIATMQIDDGIIVNLWSELADDEILKIIENLAP